MNRAFQLGTDSCEYLQRGLLETENKPTVNDLLDRENRRILGKTHVKKGRKPLI